MESSRDFIVVNKPRIILDKRFKIFNDLNVGEVGQIVIDGIIEGERIAFYNGTDIMIKTIRLSKAEKITEKAKRDAI